MARPLPDRGDNDLRRCRRSAVQARPARRGPDGFSGQNLTVGYQAAAAGYGPAKQRRRRAHPRLRRGLGPPDACQLRGRLHPPPRRDRLMVHRQGDAIRPEPVSHRDRHIGIDDGLADPHGRRTPRREFQIDLVGTHAAVQQLTKAKAVDVVKDRTGHRRRGPLSLQAIDHHVQAPINDREEERINDRHRQLAAHSRRAPGIAIEHKSGHRQRTYSPRARRGAARARGRERCPAAVPGEAPRREQEGLPRPAPAGVAGLIAALP